MVVKKLKYFLLEASRKEMSILFGLQISNLKCLTVFCVIVILSIDSQLSYPGV